MKQSKRQNTLKPLHGQRLRWQGVIERFGTKNGWHAPLKTLLLVNIQLVDNANIVIDHLWLTAGKWADGLKPGDRIAFNARVGTYTKGYFGRRQDVYVQQGIDYRLERPTKVTKLTGLRA